ncbi:MAG: putative von Willebrand factor type containing CoxE-like [Aeromicrobium sp.]|nr:putative von Willebrand factor type containing CoxE-like [Aeromicrobium sp.]
MPPATGGTTRGESDETGELAARDEQARDEALAQTRARAHEIARRIALARRPPQHSRRRGDGAARSVRWRDGSAEIDLEATIESIAGHPFPRDEDIMVRERQSRQRATVLVIDVSGSMKGERVRTAAATVGALVGELSGERISVVAFWSDAALLVPLGVSVDSHQVLDQVMSVPATGLTNVDFGLEVARRQLKGVASRDARILLVSDCVHNAGPDPREAATDGPRLDVLLDASGEHDMDLGRDLARAGRGQCRVVRTYRDVAPAVTAIFAGH